MLRIIAVCLATTLFVAPVVAAEKPADKTDATAPVTQVDKDSFVKAVLSANKFEIDSSKLVLEKTVSENVKAFAEQMIADHSKAGEDFWNVISGDGGTPKAADSGQMEHEEPPAVDLSQKQTEALNLLKGKQGAEFEAAYIALQLDAHRQAVDLFRTYADKPDDEALGVFAKKTLPVLEMHLDHIEKISAARS